MLLATTQVWLDMPPCASRNSDVYMGVIASAPAKVMLFGEHFVVYGEPVIVLAIDKRAYAKAELRQDKRLYMRSVNLNLAGYFENGYFQARARASILGGIVFTIVEHLIDLIV